MKRVTTGALPKKSRDFATHQLADDPESSRVSGLRDFPHGFARVFLNFRLSVRVARERRRTRRERGFSTGRATGGRFGSSGMSGRGGGGGTRKEGHATSSSVLSNTAMPYRQALSTTSSQPLIFPSPVEDHLIERQIANRERARVRPACLGT